MLSSEVLARGAGVPRRASLDALLRFAWDAGVFTAGDALAAVGLSRSTTIEAIDDLLVLGLVRELPNARAVGEYSKGRPSRRFELRADAAVVVGVDAGQGHVVTTVADLRGRTLATRTDLAGVADDSADRRRALVVEAIDATLADAGQSRGDVLAVCVGVPAPVDSAGRSPVHREGFWARMNPDFVELLSPWVPIVRVENDAVLASVAEHARGAAMGLRNTVTLLAGHRLGAGVVIDGTLLRGAHGGVGEVVVLRHLRGIDEAHGIGHQLEAWTGEVVASGSLPADHPLRALTPDAVTARAVIDLARSGDPEARALVERAGRRWPGSRGCSGASTTRSGSWCPVGWRRAWRSCSPLLVGCFPPSWTCRHRSSWLRRSVRTSCRSERWPPPSSRPATGHSSSAEGTDR